MEREIYKRTELDIIVFHSDDVITTSGAPSGNNSTAPLNPENAYESEMV